MPQLQTHLVKLFLKHTVGKKTYNRKRTSQHRSDFERDMALLFPTFYKHTITYTRVDGVKVAHITVPESTDRTIIYLHGGGFVFGSSKTHKDFMVRLAKLCKAKVVAIDYSLAPESPYPKALNEIQKVWAKLPSMGVDLAKTALIGDSAGANLAIASSLILRDKKRSQPACLVLLSPPLDATFSGKSYTKNRSKDIVLTRATLDFFTDSYAEGQPKTDPLLSPVFAKTHNLPPTLIHVGSDELLLSESKQFYKKLLHDGNGVTLYVAPGMWHGWHFFARIVPEAKTALRMISDFVTSKT